MSNLLQRNYRKLFTGTYQEEGYDKVHLGYEAKTSEIILKKDETTFFHIPFFAQSQNVNESFLGADGAIAGPIPAFSDRIFKFTGNYGKNTPWGSPKGQRDGVWLCSWLYSVSGEPPTWYDRYYDPGRLNYDEAFKGQAKITEYISSNTVFYDVPSTLTLDPGVWYQYFHHGERSYSEIIKTFAGPENNRLKLKIDNWSNNTKDESIYNNVIQFNNFKEDWIVNFTSLNYVDRDRSSLSFDNTDFIDCSIPFNDSLQIDNELSVSLWVYNKDWSAASSTQLFGNLNRGGYGIFYNNLKSYPIYVIPEDFYGHLYFLNQDNTLYLEKNIQSRRGTSLSPRFVHINSNTEVVTVYDQYIVKYNHLGEVITRSQDLTGGYLVLEGSPKLSLIDGHNNTTVVTTSGTYIYDADLRLVSRDTASPYIENQQVYFSFSGSVEKELNSYDVKVDSFNQKWSIKTDRRLYCDDVLYTNVELASCTNIAIDPEGRLWVLYNNNFVYKINTQTKQPVQQFTLGVTVNDGTLYEKNISFINTYDRQSNTFTWFAVAYFDYDKRYYQIALDGSFVQSILLPQKLNILDQTTAAQDRDLLRFTCKGDFTGYERNRVFNTVLYDNKSQLQFKVVAKRSFITLPDTIFSVSVPVDYFAARDWNHVLCTIKNQYLSIFVNGVFRKTVFMGTDELTYGFENNFSVGCPLGKNTNLNYEINTKNLIWNGVIDGIQIDDYALEPINADIFIREKNVTQDIVWNVPTAPLQYIEVIDRFFKHRLPGSKSTFFKLRLSGTHITDSNTRTIIENEIRKAIELVKPAYTELLKIEWID